MPEGAGAAVVVELAVPEGVETAVVVELAVPPGRERIAPPITFVLKRKLVYLLVEDQFQDTYFDWPDSRVFFR